MHIPKKLNMFGKTIEVKYSDNLMADRDAIGLADYVKDEITLQQNSKSVSISKDNIGVTFIHELTHMILNGLGYKELSSDEQFVESTSAIWYQVIKQLT